MDTKPFKQTIPATAWKFIAMYKYNDEYYVCVNDIIHYFVSEYDFRARLTDDIIKDARIVLKVIQDSSGKSNLVSMVPVTHIGFFLDSLGLPKEDWIKGWKCVTDCYTLHHLNCAEEEYGD